MKFLSRQLSKKSPLIPCPISSYQNSLLMILRPLLGSFGGDIEVSKGKFIGLVGRRCVGLNVRKVWGLEN